MKQELSSLRLRQTDSRIKAWRRLKSDAPPREGWIRSIRSAIGMTTSQLARRMGVTRQAIVDLEKREAHGNITIAALRRAADALDSDLIYAVVPRSDLREMVKRQAWMRASKQLNRVAHTMHLEAQGVSREEHEQQIAERADRLLRTWSPTLWEVDER
jgi:predicted DNA-binding mobile mystery protein A